MKVHITRAYDLNEGIIEKRQVQFAYSGHLLGMTEMGIRVGRAGTASDTEDEMSARLDGIIAAVEHDDLVIVQLPTGNGVDFELKLVDKIWAYSGRKSLFIWQDAEYYNENRDKFKNYINLEQNCFEQEYKSDIAIQSTLLDMVAQAQRAEHPYYCKTMTEPQREKKICASDFVDSIPDDFKVSTKIHITNVYGMVANPDVSKKQNRIAMVGKKLGFYEIGIYNYPSSMEKSNLMEKRIAGILSSVESNDIIYVQMPTGNGDIFDKMLIEKISDIPDTHIVIIWCSTKEPCNTINSFVNKAEVEYEEKRIYEALSFKDDWFIEKMFIDTEQTLNKVQNLCESEKDTYNGICRIYNEKSPIIVENIDETLDYVIAHNSSVARFGDGEMDIITGHGIPYQDYDETLAKELAGIMSMQSNERLVVCLSDVFEGRERYNTYAADFWKSHLERYHDYYEKLCKADWYGSTFISRPYIDLVDKTKSVGYFNKLKSLWEGRDILIVEGKTSRSGVGNDLFDKASSIKRIICPSKNAYDKIAEIHNEITKHASGRLILLMLGPTAKVLAKNLSEEGYQAIDIGHIDSEYEWFRMGATSKVKLPNKHTAEHNFDENIIFDDDKEYEGQIVADLS